MNSNLYVTNFFNVFLIFSNKTDDRMLHTDFHGYTYFGMEVV